MKVLEQGVTLLCCVASTRKKTFDTRKNEKNMNPALNHEIEQSYMYLLIVKVAAWI